MIKSIFLTSIRNLFRNPVFSLINIVGLSVSMSLGLLIILIVKDQYAFDNFHRDADRIYRINTRSIRTDGGREDYASSPLALATALQEGYTFTEQIVRINSQLNGDVSHENVTVPVRGFFADPSFLEVFNFELKEGNPASSLNDPDGILLTEDAAKKIFGNGDPMGKVIALKGYGNFTVKGIFKKPTSKSHFDFEVMASASALPALEKQGAVMESIANWTNYYSGYIYVKLKPGADLHEINAALAEISRKNYTGRKLETRDKGYEFYLQPLGKISPGPILSNNLGRALPEVVLYFLGLLAFIMLLMAGSNYTSLTVARSLKRAREIGVRKVMGAKRWQVFAQFVGESVVFAIVSLMFSYVFLQFLKSAFLNLHLTQEFSINLNEDIWIYGYFIVFAMVVGLLAGLIPAGYLSRFKPVMVLKDMLGSRTSSRQLMRKSLMVVQFTLCMVFIAGVLQISSQMNYVMKADYGINDENLLNVRLQGNDYVKLGSAVQSVPGVRQIGFVSHSLGTFSDYSDDYKRSPADAPFVMRDFRADANYLSNLKVQFVAGRNFSPGLSATRETEVVINEKAMLLLGYKKPEEALGRSLYVSDSIPLNIVGIVKDFHFRPMNYQIGPMAFRYRPSDFNLMSISFEPGSKDKLVAALSPIWKSIDKVHPLQQQLMRDELEDAYTISGFKDVLNIIKYITFLSVILACMGLLGMVMYNTRLRTKEISVRKVVGADVKALTILLSKSFLWLTAIGILIGIPISFMLGNLFLQNYAYKISYAPWLVVLAVGITILLGLITICSQTIVAALSNPVKALRSE